MQVRTIPNSLFTISTWTVKRKLPAKRLQVDESRCVGCKQCIRELGCPAISLKGQKAYIEPDLCFGCTICAQICKPGAIREEDAQ